MKSFTTLAKSYGAKTVPNNNRHKRDTILRWSYFVWTVWRHGEGFHVSFSHCSLSSWPLKHRAGFFSRSSAPTRVFLMILKAVFLRHIPFSDLFLIRGIVFSFVAFSGDVFPYQSCSVFPIQPALHPCVKNHVP